LLQLSISLEMLTDITLKKPNMSKPITQDQIGRDKLNYI
jgi:hypothetical protein